MGGVVPWTREQIEAWVHYYDASTWMSPQERRGLRLARQTIVRLLPEAPDYDAVVERCKSVPGWVGIPLDWHEVAADEEIVSYTEGRIAALMAQSFSAPVAGDAEDDHDAWR